MRKTLAISFCVLLMLGVVFAQTPGVDTTSVDLGKGKVTIRYGTPKLGARNIDDMIKPGLAWRMGMNAATTLETTVDLDFGGKKLASGKYSLFARSDESRNWTLLVSSGTASVLDPATVVLEAPLHFMKDAESQDLLKITLEKAAGGASLSVAWGTHRLHASFKVAS